MSLSFISVLQEKLYEVLKQHELFRLMNIGVYFSVQQDAKYPFILINILKSSNISNASVERYEVDFELCIFVRGKGQDTLLKIGSAITNLLKVENLYSEHYHLIGINNKFSEWVRGQDLMTMKLVINYKALLRV